MLPFREYSILPKHSPTEAMLIIGGYQQVGVPITEHICSQTTGTPKSGPGMWCPPGPIDLHCLVALICLYSCAAVGWADHHGSTSTDGCWCTGRARPPQ